MHCRSNSLPKKSRFSNFCTISKETICRFSAAKSFSTHVDSPNDVFYKWKYNVYMELHRYFYYDDEHRLVNALQIAQYWIKADGMWGEEYIACAFIASRW